MITVQIVLLWAAIGAVAVLMFRLIGHINYYLTVMQHDIARLEDRLNQAKGTSE